MIEKYISRTRIRLSKFLIPMTSVVMICGLMFAFRSLPDQEESALETCTICHQEWTEEFLKTPHSGIQDCTPCHGHSDVHIENGSLGTIFAFKDTESAIKKNQTCLSCHSEDSGSFFISPHGKSSMDCVSCHTIHYADQNPKLLKQKRNQNCSVCHQDVMAKFTLNERHRLREGILDCVTCHDPHGPSSRERLTGFKHQVCFQCHTDKSGPFLHEHPASRIEGCMICHDVHGSSNRHMLKFQSVGDLCFSCHSVAPSFHRRFDSRTTNCVICHSSIHGSNLSPYFLR